MFYLVSVLFLLFIITVYLLRNMLLENPYSLYGWKQFLIPQLKTNLALESWGRRTNIQLQLEYRKPKITNSGEVATWGAHLSRLWLPASPFSLVSVTELSWLAYLGPALNLPELPFPPQLLFPIKPSHFWLHALLAPRWYLWVLSLLFLCHHLPPCYLSWLHSVCRLAAVWTLTAASG